MNERATITILPKADPSRMTQAVPAVNPPQRINVVTVIPHEWRRKVQLEVSAACMDELWNALVKADPHEWGAIRTRDRVKGPLLMLQAVWVTEKPEPKEAA